MTKIQVYIAVVVETYGFLQSFISFRGICKGDENRVKILSVDKEIKRE